MAEAAREAPREPRELPDEPLTQPLEASRECTVAGEPRRFCEVGDSDTAQKFLTRLTVRARSANLDRASGSVTCLSSVGSA